MTLGEKSIPAGMPKFCPACRERFPPDALFCPNDGTPLLSAPKADPAATGDGPDPYSGREISGHIEVRQLAGVGAMGRVYRAFQKGIDRDVAVKILHRELSANAQLVSRFHREAKVASRLQHPNVVHVHLAGQLPDGALYIVMEYLDGMSLQSALNACGGAMPLPRALHITLQLCDAVGEAHAQGIVHRDLKPENVMLVKRGQDTDYVKVLDFGIARLSWGEQSMATAAGLIFGTARYISPEGAQGEGVGPAGDVYAIATLLYQMLAGRTPFEGEQAVGLLIQQIHDSPPLIQSIPRASYVPGPVAAVIMQNLAKSPHARAPDARAFARSILEAARMAGLSADDYAPPAMRISGQMKLSPMQQTRQLQLSPEVAERLSPPPSSEDRSSEPVRDERAKLVPGAATAKWTPSPEFQAQIAPRAQTKSGVDETLDDDDVPPPQPAASAPAPMPSRPVLVPQAAPSAPSTVPTPPPPMSAASEPAPYASGDASPYKPTRTEYAEAPPISIHHQQQSYPPLKQPMGFGASPSAPPAVESVPRTLHTPTPSKPFSNVDSTLSDEPAPGRWIRYAVIFVLLFFAGSAVAAFALYRLGYLDSSVSATAKIDDALAKANDAMVHERWDSPPGDNVKDITDAALVRWPHDPRVVQLRARASDELVKRAVGMKLGGDSAGALHLAALASELDPTDETTKSLVREYQAELGADAGALAGSTDAGRVAPLATNPPVQPTGGPRATLDASPAKPKLGQSVEFTARALAASGGAPKKVENPAFILAGPGIAAGTKLNAMGEGSIYRGGFSFLEPGKYDITFTARVDGSLVRSARTVVVEGAGAPASTGTDNPNPQPSASVKWL